MRKMGFIGVGNMSGALIEPVCEQLGADQVAAYDHHLDRLGALADELGFAVLDSASDVVAKCECVVVGVKPYGIDGLLDEIAPALLKAAMEGSKTVLVSIAAGYGIEDFHRALAYHLLETPVVRMMPNSGVRIGEGVCLFAPDDRVAPEQLAGIVDAFVPAGLCEQVDEDTLERSVAVFSCSPAYVYIFIESLADAGVELGLERDLAMRLAKQAVKGTAANAIASDKHVAELREELATPRGMTITSTNHMEKLGFRAAVIGGVLKAHEQSKKML